MHRLTYCHPRLYQRSMYCIRKTFVALCSLFFITDVPADTIDNYMNIANNIPKMEMQADSQSQTWARSARNILIIADETIAETLTQANETARAQGKPLFCLPPETRLDAKLLGSIILESYQKIPSNQEKDKMTVSQVAWLGVTQRFPCGSSREARP